MDYIDQQILYLLKDARDNCQPVPSYEELLAKIPRSSLATIHTRIHKLMERGLVEKPEAGKARSHGITENGVQFLSDEANLRGYTRATDLWPNYRG
jgi:Fe2+ or Zn2+ uptake regulation protein